jgi:hypothetical protein
MYRSILSLVVLAAAICALACAAEASNVQRHRVLISTDIGGTDPDDFQSLIHYLTYADRFETEGLISSPPGVGRKEDVLRIIDRYEVDYPKLKRRSATFPTPDTLRAVTKQGETDRAPGKGWRRATEGSRWIVRCAMKDDSRPLYVLVWGGLEDVAQALHDEPEIRSRIRVFFIGGPNKKWSADAYDYVQRNFPDLWMIESNSTYRGWFVGGNRSGEFGNAGFYDRHVKGRGALGREFGNHYGGTIKMGDTPSVAYLLHGNPDDPHGPGWGGSYVRTPSRPKHVFRRHTTAADVVETFALVEWELKGPEGQASDDSALRIEIDGQEFEGYCEGGGTYRVRFVPKGPGRWSYRTKSAIAAFDGKSGEFTSVNASSEPRREDAAFRFTRWWTDDPDPSLSEGPHQGARTISRWRAEFLHDWAKRLAWLEE